MPAAKTTVYLDPGDYERLKMIARRRRQSPAALLRDAVREYTDRHDVRRGPRSIGAGRSGTGTLSERAEQLLKGMGRRR
jgi:predicted transcriptional regulator